MITGTSRRPRLRLQLAQDLPAIDPGQEDVEHDRGWLCGHGASARPLSPSEATRTAVAGLGQVGLEQAGRARLVLDDEDVRSVRGPPARHAAQVGEVGAWSTMPDARSGRVTVNVEPDAELRLDLDATTVRLDQAPCQGQPEAGPGLLLRLVADLAELLEDAGLVLGARCPTPLSWTHDPDLVIRPRAADAGCCPRPACT